MFNLKIKKVSLFSGIISKINFKLLITLTCLLFLGNSIKVNFQDLTNQRIDLIQIFWLFGGIIFSLLSIIINAYAWKLLINNIGCNSNKLNVIKIFLNTNIYKYFPGGIWHLVSRYNLLRLKFTVEKSVESVLLEPLLMLVAGLILIPLGGFNILVLIICWSSTLLLLTKLREFIVQKLKSMKSTIFTSNGVNDIDFVRNKQNISSKIFYPYKPLFVEIIFLLFRFFGFLSCINAFSVGSLISKGELISCFSLAWITGLVVPAAPGGLGVFESVILFCLGSQLPEASLLAALLCYRIVSTVSDVLASLIYPVRRLLKV